MRRVLGSCLLLMLGGRVAASQEAGIIIGAGFGALTVRSLIRLAELPSAAAYGDELRVKHRAGEALLTTRGRLTALNADSITLTNSEGVHPLARTDAITIRVFKGKETKWAQGWALGFLGGGALGAIGGYTSGDDHDGFFNFTHRQKAGVFGAAFAFLGSFAGALAGSMVTGDHWRRVSKLPSVLPALP